MIGKELPVYLDEPNMIFLWKDSEVFPFVMICIVGLIANYLTTAIVCAFIYVKLVRKLTENKPRNFFKHWLWYRGLLPLTTPTLPNPFVRRYY